ncbi:MAG: SDR family NAD(P)-dependent oxidoreductase, partial [Bacteroidota bacterium]|nr:SDR family NAD(P)-dependent oxidoreductase [Bacteroidota bacterium]
AMDGWGGYCSSKAAINMMSEVAALESNIAENGFKIFSLAPGVVDTDMQNQIRRSNKEKFSDYERFVQLKENGELSNPLAAAEKIMILIERASDFKDVMQDVRRF